METVIGVGGEKTPVDNGATHGTIQKEGSVISSWRCPMPARKLKQFLDDNGVDYTTISHTVSYTAQGVAHAAHVSGKEVAKTVICKSDGDLIMAVLPANLKVDPEALREAIGARKVELASEQDFADAFPGCELGAMPPFGNLWDVPVYVAEELTRDEQIAFNAGTHIELVQMTYADFERLASPTVLTLTYAHA